MSELPAEIAELRERGFHVLGVGVRLGDVLALDVDALERAIERGIDPRWMPALVFLVAGAISFATGTSWGTMAILVPLVILIFWIGLYPKPFFDLMSPAVENLVNVISAASLAGLP